MRRSRLALALTCCAAFLAAAVASPAADRARLQLRASPNPSTAGQLVAVSGEAPRWRRLVLWERGAGALHFRRVATTWVGATGSFVFYSHPRKNRSWYVTAGRRRSATIRQSVHAVVTLTVTATRAGDRLSGTVTPSHAGESIALQRGIGGGWRTFATTRLDSGSRFSATRAFGAAARVRALFRGDELNARASSTAVAITGGRPSVTARLGRASTLPPDYFGFNWDYPGAALFSRDLLNEYAALAALHSGNLRWPGGTDANYFLWQSGYPTNQGQLNGFAYSLQDLANAYQATGAAPVFDLNVMTDTLDNQIQMLHAAQALGIPVRYLELGNEFYLDTPRYDAAFPTAADYGRAVATWVMGLHQAFPGALVAAVGSDEVHGHDRASNWNAQSLSAARAAGALPDAITLHLKPSWNGPVTTSLLPGMFGEPYQAVQQANAVMAALPGQEPAWLTEYNLAPDVATNAGQQVFAHTLFVAELELLVQRVTRATLTDYWTALSTSPNAAFIPASDGEPQLTPAGLAMQWVASAAANATASAPIRFGGGPLLSSHGPSALVGCRFSGGGAVVVNLSPRTVLAPAGAAIASGSGFQQVSGDPTALVSYASQLTVTTGTVGDMVSLPPYSLTLLDG